MGPWAARASPREVTNAVEMLGSDSEDQDVVPAKIVGNDVGDGGLQIQAAQTRLDRHLPE